jgi:hypothetical protein
MYSPLPLFSFTHTALQQSFDFALGLLESTSQERLITLFVVYRHHPISHLAYNKRWDLWSESERRKTGAVPRDHGTYAEKNPSPRSKRFSCCSALPSWYVDAATIPAHVDRDSDEYSDRILTGDEISARASCRTDCHHFGLSLCLEAGAPLQCR